jgi:hypothetical protein
VALFGRTPPLVAAAKPPVASGIAGTVVVTDADGETFPLSGVRLILTCDAQEAPRVEVSDESGAFRFDRAPLSSCRIVTDVQGFAAATADVRGNSGDIRFHLRAVPIFVGLNVVPDGGATGRMRGEGTGGKLPRGAQKVPRGTGEPRTNQNE